MSDLTRACNQGRFDPAAAGGFYESYFQRANHPRRPLAFWIRYTVFSPRGRPQDAIGELWAVWFDGETGRHVVAKSEVPIARVRFARDAFDVRIGEATLQPGCLRGTAASPGRTIEWRLEYAAAGPGTEPLFLLPAKLYAGSFPKAKSLVGLPLARFRGALVVDGVEVSVDDWVGSQNHNWGTRHTDRYAWGQVAGFDNAPGSFLEVATGQLKLGPFWTPRLTPLVLRHDGAEFALTAVAQALRARGRFGDFHWDFRSAAAGVEIEGRITAPREAFVGLRYYNPPGGDKWCLNSKIASCSLTLRRAGRAEETLVSRHRAAFELLTDDTAHGVEILA